MYSFPRQRKASSHMVEKLPSVWEPTDKLINGDFGRWYIVLHTVFYSDSLHQFNCYIVCFFIFLWDLITLRWHSRSVSQFVFHNVVLFLFLCTFWIRCDLNFHDWMLVFSVPLQYRELLSSSQRNSAIILRLFVGKISRKAVTVWSYLKIAAPATSTWLVGE